MLMIRTQTATADASGARQVSFSDAALQRASAPPDTRGKRAAEISPSTYNSKTHTVELVLSRGARVRRWGFYEELLIDAAAVDLSRVGSGAVKVLNSHNAFDVRAIFGTVLSTRFEGGALVGLMKFGETTAAVEAEGMVARGELTSVSIGYEVKLWRAVETVADPSSDVEITVWRAEQWALLEVSFVSVPADPNAGVRSAMIPAPGITPPTNSGATEDSDMLTRSGSESGAVAPATPPVAGVTRFTGEESVFFIDLARSFGVEDRARELVALNARGEVGVQECRIAALRAAAERNRANVAGIGGGGAAVVTRDESDVSHRGIEDALVSRLSGKAPSDVGRQFRSMSMVDMIRYRMRLRGERDVEFLSPTEVVKRMHTTSDFPMLLNTSGHRVLMEMFNAAPNAIKSVARRTTIDDFRTKYSIKLGPFPALPLVPEGGEIKAGTVTESYENYKLGTFAEKFVLSRQAIINDDLGAFADFSRRMAGAAAETEASQLVALFTANNGQGPKLVDGNYLFSAAHRNVADAGAAISKTTLSAARLAMRTQTSIDGKTLAPAVPTTLLVGAAKETEGEEVLSALAAAKVEDTNPFAGKLTLGVEPRLAGTPWYVLADPAMSPVLEYAYLTGAEGPQIEMREGWDVLGVEFRIVLDFGCGVIDHHGAYRNAGN